MAARPYNVLSICAGVGGLELGVRIARSDARAVCYIEREIPAATVLAARIKDGSLHEAPIWSDLTTFDPEPWRGLVDCITSGDPCQPNSVAGKGLGADDDRWLLDHIMRIVEVVRPHRFFRENVPGNANGQLEYLIPALERMGRRVAVGIFSAGEDAQASHRRERLFLMADDEGVGGGEGGLPLRKIKKHTGTYVGYGSVADNASERRREARDEHSERPEEWSRQCDSLGDTSSGGRRSQGDDSQSSGRTYRPNTPLFAPGPSDPRWPSIIHESPSLAPAISEFDETTNTLLREIEGMGRSAEPEEIESILRRVDARMAQRVDRLRECGNGVSSLAAAIAWDALEANLYS